MNEMVKIDIMWLNMWSYGGNLEFWKLLIGEKETTSMGETFFFLSNLSKNYKFIN